VCEKTEGAMLNCTVWKMFPCLSGLKTTDCNSWQTIA